MSWTNGIRKRVVARLPEHWQPVANFHYYRLRSLLEREMPMLCRQLGPGACAVDVGANEGVYTHAFARTGARVEAFEPLRSCSPALHAYARRHPNVRVHELALGESEGTATLSVPGRDGQVVSGRATLLSTADGVAEFRVPVRALDSFEFPRVDVLKIDVEGYEFEVLRGARATIARCRPLLLVEIEQRHIAEPMASAFARIAALGYTGRFVLPDGARPIDDFDPGAYQRDADADKLHRLYVNNFVFTPNERPVSPA